MKRIKVTLATLFLAAVAPVAVAQHGGHGGTSSGGGFGNSGSDAPNRDFQRAIMLSATEDQRAAFARCMESASRSLRIADGMTGSSSGANYDAAALAKQKGQLEAALTERETTHQHFRHSLSQPQEKELRKHLAKLDRFRSEMDKRIAQLERELSSGKPDSRRLSGDTRKIKELAEKWQAEHRKIAEEMGIEGA